MAEITRKDRALYNTGCIVAMLYVNDSKLLLADEHAIYEYSIPDGIPSLIVLGEKKIPDMTNVDSYHFAFIDQGTWFHSRVYKCKKLSGEKVSSFKTDTYCSGIAHTNYHYFLTYSANKNRNPLESSFVKIYDEEGCQMKIIQVGFNKDNLFSRQITKIFVKFNCDNESNCDIYVADVGRRCFVMTRFSFQGKAYVKSVWRDIVPSSISTCMEDILPNSITSMDDKLILALGGSMNEIVIMKDQWSKKIVTQRQLKGEPTAVCVAGKYVAVATKKMLLFSRWFPQLNIQFFEINEARSEDSVKSM